MEEKIQSVQYRDSEPSEFAHKPPKQEMDLSCSPGRVHSARVTHLVDEQRYRDYAERCVAGLVEPQV